MNKNRRRTSIVKIGNLKIGGNEPIRIQSMLTSETTNVEACIKEILKLTGYSILAISQKP